MAGYRHLCFSGEDVEAQQSSPWSRSATTQGPGPYWLPPRTAHRGGQPASHFPRAPDPGVQSAVTDTAADACTPTPAPAPPQLTPETTGQRLTGPSSARPAPTLQGQRLFSRWFPWGQAAHTGRVEGRDPE